jgi:hypothetical protein
MKDRRSRQIINYFIAPIPRDGAECTVARCCCHCWLIHLAYHTLVVLKRKASMAMTAVVLPKEVVMKESTMIQSFKLHRPIGIYSIWLGIFLVLHAPAWILLVSYCDKNKGIDSFLLSMLSYFVLKWSPWVVSVAWSLFLAGLFLFIGFAKVTSKME